MNESLQEQATLYAMNLLTPEEAAALEQQMANDAELRDLVDDLLHTTADLALLTQPIAPPAHLKAAIMAQIAAPAKASPVQATLHRVSPSEGAMPAHRPSNMNPKPKAKVEAPRRGGSYLGWGIAAALAVGSAWLVSERNRMVQSLGEVTAKFTAVSTQLVQEREHSRTLKTAIAKDQTIITATQAQLAEAQLKTAQLNAAIAEFKRTGEQDRATFAGQLARLNNDLDTLRKSDTRARTEIAMLRSDNASYKQGVAVVVWNNEKHVGILKLEKMPPIAPGKDYQLWVIDPKVKTGPVNAGVIKVDEKGFAKIDFKPVVDVGSATAFAVSVEREGGVSTKSEDGPIVLIGANGP